MNDIYRFFRVGDYMGVLEIMYFLEKSDFVGLYFGWKRFGWLIVSELVFIIYRF